MRNFINRIKNFFLDESGSELMQWAIIIVIVAVLAVIAMAMSGTLQDKLTEAQGALEQIG